MVNRERRILIVEDDEGLGLVLAGLLAQAGLHSEHVLTAEAGLGRLEREPFDAVLTDLRLPGLDGLGLLGRVRAMGAGIPVLMLTAHGSISTAVEAMRSGAADFLQKPFDREEILYALEKAIRGHEKAADAAPVLPPVDGAPLGESASMKLIDKDMAKAAQVIATVLLRGESGTGKEVAARWIHRSSDRAGHPFIPVHCGALPEALLESELFGYQKGAFTGAAQNKPGRVELAEGGTLFLDEIGDISPAIQVKLLRLLQEKEYQPLGAQKGRIANVRFIAATHRDLEAMVARGEFREDLYYRLNVLPIWLPPLRERGEDVALLATHFLGRLGPEQGRRGQEFSESALRALRTHDWPGNVRELENVVERLVVFSETELIGESDVMRELERLRPRSSSAPERTGAPSSSSPSLGAQRAVAEKAAVEDALRRCQGNRTQAARLLGVSRRTLYTRLSEFDLG